MLALRTDKNGDPHLHKVEMVQTGLPEPDDAELIMIEPEVDLPPGHRFVEIPRSALLHDDFDPESIGRRCAQRQLQVVQAEMMKATS